TKRNPQFLRVFFLEHNLERFATNLYEHQQPSWYYLAVMVLALLPWTVVAIRALVDAVIESINEWRARLAKNRYISHARWGDAFPEFLVLWTLFPIAFFSLSHSKLPGYILPSIPPLTILTGDYLNRLREADKGIRPWLLLLHALLAGFTVTMVLLLPWFIFHAAGGMPPGRVMVSAIVTGIATIVLLVVVVGRFGVNPLRIATMVPLVVLVFFLFGVGPFFGLPAVQQTKH